MSQGKGASYCCWELNLGFAGLGGGLPESFCWAWQEPWDWDNPFQESRLSSTIRGSRWGPSLAWGKQTNHRTRQPAGLSGLSLRPTSAHLCTWQCLPTHCCLVRVFPYTLKARQSQLALRSSLWPQHVIRNQASPSEGYLGSRFPGSALEPRISILRSETWQFFCGHCPSPRSLPGSLHSAPRHLRPVCATIA